MSSGAEEPSDDASAPTRRLANLDLSETKGDAAHYDDDNTTYHHQLYTGPIIDPHVHFFCFERISYPWLKGPNQIPKHPLLGNIDMLRQKSYELADLEADAKRHNVVKWIYVQAEAEDSIIEAEYVESVILSHPSVAGIVAYADLESASAELDANLGRLARLPHVKGIRHLLNFHPDKPHISNPSDTLSHPSFDSNYALLAKHNLHFEFHGYSNQLRAGAAVAKAHPTVPVIINHSGLCIDHTEEGIEEWKAGLAEFAALSHVSIKISGLGMTDNKWTAESIRPFILDIIRIFGVERCMFASNFPVEKVVGAYSDWYTAFKQIVATLPLEQQKKLFHDNAIRYYRLGGE